MQSEQLIWSEEGWQVVHGQLQQPAGLVLLFAARERLTPACLEQVAARYPGALLLGCSTAGEICDTRVLDGTVLVTAVQFAATSLELVSETLAAAGDSTAMGRSLAARLPQAGLRHVLVLSDGLEVNGTELVAGLRQGLPSGMGITGGLAGDDTAFGETRVVCGQHAASGLAAALGFYGERLRIGHGCLGGWDTFGPQRLITRSAGNVLYELDGQPALALYKRYLGEHAAGLPFSGLHFPLALSGPDGKGGLVRTVQAIDEAEGSMTFAGAVPEGSYARLMKANLERLIDGAAGAARQSCSGLEGGSAQLALLISCVGRRLVLEQRVEEELESVRDLLGPQARLCGFYSYGEISPYLPTARCELHNQTMTITTFSES